MVYTTATLTPRMRPSMKLAESSTKMTAVAASGSSALSVVPPAQYQKHTGPLQPRSEAISAPSFHATMQSHLASPVAHFPGCQTLTTAPAPAAIKAHSLPPMRFEGAEVTNHTSVSQSTSQLQGCTARLVTVKRTPTTLPAAVNLPHFHVSTQGSQPLPSVTYQKPVGLVSMSTEEDREESINMVDEDSILLEAARRIADLSKTGTALLRPLLEEVSDGAKKGRGRRRSVRCCC